MEPWRAVDAHNGGMEAQMVADSHHIHSEPDPDPDQHLSEN